MRVIVKLKPCGPCKRDPAFGIIHHGCSKCTIEYEERDKQPRLVFNKDNETYEEAA